MWGHHCLLEGWTGCCNLVVLSVYVITPKIQIAGYIEIKDLWGEGQSGVMRIICGNPLGLPWFHLQELLLRYKESIGHPVKSIPN